MSKGWTIVSGMTADDLAEQVEAKVADGYRTYLKPYRYGAKYYHVMLLPRESLV